MGGPRGNLVVAPVASTFMRWHETVVRASDVEMPLTSNVNARAPPPATASFDIPIDMFASTAILYWISNPKARGSGLDGYQANG